MTEKFDIERRARELMRPHLGGKDDERAAVQLARETAQAIAGEIEAERATLYARGDAFSCSLGNGASIGSGIARRYAEPPKPETREERLEKALRGLLSDPVMQGLGGASIDEARRAMEEKP